MLSTSDNIRKLAAFVVFLLPGFAYGQDLGVRVDSAAYSAARENPSTGVYFFVSWEPAAAGPNLNTTILSMRYTWGRPADYSTVSRFGFQNASGAVTSRYILADGTSFILANSEGATDSILANINQNLSRFGLASVSERESAIRSVDSSSKGQLVPTDLIDTGALMNQIFSGLIPFILLGLGAGLSILALRVGVAYLFKGSDNKSNVPAVVESRSIDAPTIHEVMSSYDVAPLLAAGNSRPDEVGSVLDEIATIKADYEAQFDSLSDGDRRSRERSFLKAYLIADRFYSLRARSREEKLILGEMYTRYRLDRDKNFIDYWYNFAVHGTADYRAYHLDKSFNDVLHDYEEPWLFEDRFTEEQDYIL